MSGEERLDRYWNESSRGRFAGDERRSGRENEKDEDAETLPTLSIVHVPHEKIPNLFQYCCEYVDPSAWSAEAELVETGRWFFTSPKV
jgi:hypothetical protein